MAKRPRPDLVADVPLKDHFDAILDEKSRALEMSADEREKAASALRGQQDRAEDRATQEREKAAAALATSLERSIREGDERLREHIANQILQINAALTSADKLEIERLGHALDLLKSLEARIEVARLYSEKAIDKADRATELRFSGFNEFNDRIAAMTATFPTREVVESRLKANQDRIEKLELAQTAIVVADTARATELGVNRQRTQWSVGLIVTIVLGGIGIAAGVFGTLVSIGLYLALHR